MNTNATIVTPAEFELTDEQLESICGGFAHDDPDHHADHADHRGDDHWGDNRGGDDGDHRWHPGDRRGWWDRWHHWHWYNNWYNNWD
jgi:hypothetical protein